MLVIDCAALVDLLTAVPGTDDLREFLDGRALHAPSLVDYEAVSAVRGLTLGGHLSASRAQDVLTDLDDLPLRRWSSADALRRRAFQLRDNVSAHDAVYVALAESLGCPLVTRDTRLGRSAGHDAEIIVR